MITVLHTEQCEPAVFPAVVQVAATALSVTALCPVALIVSVFVSPHFVQVYVLTPVAVQVAVFVTLPLSQICVVHGADFSTIVTGIVVYADEDIAIINSCFSPIFQ